MKNKNEKVQVLYDEVCKESELKQESASHLKVCGIELHSC